MNLENLGRYPKFRISSVYDLLECEKRFFLIETGKAVRKPTVQMINGARDHLKFEKKLMSLPEAEDIWNLRESFLKALENKKRIVSSEVPLEVIDNEFKLLVRGKMDCVIISPEENLIKVVENKPRMSEYALLQGILYGYSVGKLLEGLNPKIQIEIRDTKSQEVFEEKNYSSIEDIRAKNVLTRVGKLLNKEVEIDSMGRCAKPTCHCSRFWW